MQKIIGVKFRETGKAYSFDPDGKTFVPGDKVVVDSASMLCLGEVAFSEKEIDETALQEPLKKVIRKATAEDLKKFENLKEKASHDIVFVKQKVRDLGLEMKIVSAEYSLDGTKIVIEFSAEERVDFRELLKELASALKVRIELHQVGQRDEVKIKGGLGPCGEICCCRRFLKDFEHVTVKMAKNQGLSLSPTKISGLCGRLMCCLAYENKNYEEVLKRMPKVNSKINSPKGFGTVVYNDILRERVSVKVQGADDSFTVYDFALEELKNENSVQEEKQDKQEKQDFKPMKTFAEDKPKSKPENKPAKENIEKDKNNQNPQNNSNKQPNKKFNKNRHFNKNKQNNNTNKQGDK